MTNVILSGGSGTRLWPISRTLFPKQYNKLFDNQSLFQKTYLRNKTSCSQTLVITNEEQYFMAMDQLEEVTNDTIPFMLEPVGRNTAPAIALAALMVEPDEILLVTPSDHLVREHKAYGQVLNDAKQMAEKGFLVTFGITPEYPETGYGYIEANGNDVLSFKEKPDQATAETYIKKGNFYWNSGIFCFKASVFLEELQSHAPEIHQKAVAAYANRKGDAPCRIQYDDMLAIPEESIDYAIMEKSNRVKVIPSTIGWSDMGSFDALYEELPKDSDHNTLAQNTITINAKNNLLLTSERMIAAVDVEDLLIVDTPDALLVSKKGSSQKVKEVVKQLKESGTDLHNIHMTAHRPWGTYTILEESERYKIKRIVVKPGKRLSLQKHLHRNEHWIVVSGSATVTVGNETKLVRANESTYIPMGILHRLENAGKIDLVLIEAQVGEYLGEDDIIRVDDDYNRQK